MMWNNWQSWGGMPGWGGQSWIWLLVAWDLVWRGLGMWRAAKENKKYWFVAILVINSVGIVPLVYLIFFAKKKLFKK